MTAVAANPMPTRDQLPATWFPLKRHPVREALWNCNKRFVYVPAGRSSGKTEIAKRHHVRWLPVRLATDKSWVKRMYFFGAPTERQAKRIAWQHLLDLIPKRWVPDGGISISELRIETVFGSILYVVGMDKPERIEGDQWHGCTLDESCDLKPKTFERNVLPSLSQFNGWCWRIGVPKRQGPSAGEFRAGYEDATTGDDPDAAGFQWPSRDIVSRDTLEAARRRMDAKEYLQQFDAQFLDAGGGVFHAFSRTHNVRRCEYSPQCPIVVGMDFNVDPMAWTLGHRQDDALFWFDELWLRDTNTPDALKVLWGKYGDSHKGGWKFYGDATGRARKTSATTTDYLHILNHPGFKAAGRTVHFPDVNPAREDRFAACNAMFCNAADERRMFVDPCCEHLIEDLEARARPPGKREVEDKDDRGHITDAMGYAVHALFPVMYETDYRGGITITMGAD